MTLREFNALNEQGKTSILCNAMFLSYREEGEVTIVHYRVYDFYLEVYYDREDDSILSIITHQNLRERTGSQHYSLN